MGRRACCWARWASTSPRSAGRVQARFGPNAIGELYASPVGWNLRPRGPLCGPQMSPQFKHAVHNAVGRCWDRDKMPSPARGAPVARRARRGQRGSAQGAGRVGSLASIGCARASLTAAEDRQLTRWLFPWVSQPPAITPSPLIGGSSDERLHRRVLPAERFRSGSHRVPTPRVPRHSSPVRRRRSRPSLRPLVGTRPVSPTRLPGCRRTVGSNADGDMLVGAHGLTRRPTAHALAIGEQRLHTWCAYDARGHPCRAWGDRPSRYIVPDLRTRAGRRHRRRPPSRRLGVGAVDTGVVPAKTS